MVLGLIWFLSHLWVVEVILASSFRERERKGDFGTFFDGDPSKRILPVNWERSRSRLFSKDRSHSPRWKRRVSFVVVSSFSRSLSLSSSYSRSGCLPLMFSFLLWENFLFCLLSMKNCCFGRADLLALLLFLVANSWGGGKSWPRLFINERLWCR